MLVKIGDIFDSKCSVIVNTVNCVGVMGKGIAKEFKMRYPEMYADYVQRCSSGSLRPGRPYIYDCSDGRRVINFPTKDHWRSPSRISFIVEGLNWFEANYNELGIESVAFPPLGCGNGGLKWSDVGPIMYQCLAKLPIEVEIYAPYGTGMREMTDEFLMCPVHATDRAGMTTAKVNPKWYLILQVVRELNEQRYALSVGRTIYQKICYVITRNNVQTGFHFVKGNYGPFSSDARDALALMSNANLIIEKQLGRMISLQVSDRWEIDMKQYPKSDSDAVRMTVELFRRIKSTAQAEIVATVLYAYDQLSSDKLSSGTLVSDMDVYDYVIDWKPAWRTEKNDELCDAIYNMAMLEQIKIGYSGCLPGQCEVI